MFTKLALLSLVAFAASAPQHQQPAQFPAGVNPALCPGFPICDNALLHNPQPWNAPQPQWNAPQPQWNAPQPQWNAPQPQWNAPQPQWNAPQPQWNAPNPQWNAPALPSPSNALPPADKYPAGVSPQSCPNYPYCDVNGGHGQAAAPPLPGFTERLYPAGVSAHECPNFPYCN